MTTLPQPGRLTFAEHSAAKKRLRATTPSHPSKTGCPIFGAFFAPKVGIRAKARTVFADPATRYRCRR